MPALRFTNTLLSRVAVLGLACSAVFAATTASAAPIITESFQTGLPNGSIQYGPDQSGTYGTSPGAPVVIPNVTFNGFSGVITNGAAGVFNDAPDGNEAAFVQAYQGAGSQIDWALSGLTYGKEYRFSFSSAGSLVVPTAPFTVSGLGFTSTTFTPGTSYTTNNLFFVANGTSGTISFSTPGGPSNVATALDAFSISTVPEPAAWAMMIGGFGVVGGAMRQRKRETAKLATA